MASYSLHIELDFKFFTMVSHGDPLFLMREVVEDEGDGALPRPLQDGVGDALLVCAVVPL